MPSRLFPAVLALGIGCSSIVGEWEVRSINGDSYPEQRSYEYQGESCSYEYAVSWSLGEDLAGEMQLASSACDELEIEALEELLPLDASELDDDSWQVSIPAFALQLRCQLPSADELSCEDPHEALQMELARVAD